ncbi:MAG: hypothetical protein O7D34_00365, partial [Ignavibacteria bacterium]|nr:hypothetical protein [Ignavibacteria bacterium]
QIFCNVPILGVQIRLIAACIPKFNGILIHFFLPTLPILSIHLCANRSHLTFIASTSEYALLI